MGWWHLTWKDLRLQVRDRRSLAVLLILPLIFISIIGMSTGKMAGWRASNQEIQVAWVDRDGGELAQRLRKKLNEKGDVRIEVYADTESAKRDVSSSKMTMSLTIGPEFQKRVDELELRDFFARKQGQGRLAKGIESLDIAVDTKPAWSWVAKLVTNNLSALTMDEVFPIVAARNDLGRTLIDNMAAADDPGIATSAIRTESTASVLQTTVSDGRPYR